MYKPKFHYTHKMVKKLIEISEKKTIIYSKLSPKWEVKLKQEAIINRAHYSTSIEGNKLNLNQIRELSVGHEIHGKNRDKQEVLNYINALEKISKFSKGNFSLEKLLEIQGIITKNTLEYFEDEGRLRNRQVYVVKASKVVFTPPDTENVPFLINRFLDWFNSINFDEISPIIVAGLTHYELVRIHPFIDGNGRAARIMANLVLFKSGFDLKGLFTLDEYYDNNRHLYYDMLNKVDKDSSKLTEWLEYFVEGVAISVKQVEDKISETENIVKSIEENRQIKLNDRQIKIIEKIDANGKITNKDVREMFSITKTPANNELSKLIKLNLIKIVGKGRGSYYILV